MLFQGVAADQAEAAAPAGLGRKMLHEVEQMIHRNHGLGERLGGGIVGPVNDQGFADDVATGHEAPVPAVERGIAVIARSEEHTSELQSLRHLVCRLLLEKKKTRNTT